MAKEKDVKKNPILSSIKNLNEKDIDWISGKTGFNRLLIVKDFYITILLYLLKDVEGIVFKGGTALQRTVLNYSRISEDIDLTLEKDLNVIKKEIMKIFLIY
jgi:predicted nucleotidyltransferase component of viral defense system